MDKRSLLGGIALAVVAAGSAHAAHLNNMIVFGDSLSDGGRLFAITGGTQPASPPYFQGRFSNGPVWVEQLPAKLGFTYSFATNFAVGGAESGTGGPVGVATQVNTLSAAAPVNAGTLVVIWAGANDVLNRATTTPPAVLVPSIVGNIATSVGRMATRGARNFLVPNLPDLGRTPGGAATGQGFNLGALTQTYNQAMAGQMTALEASTGARIIVMDTFGLFTDVLANPSLYGITNTATPCLTTAGPTGACATAAAAQGALFWDPIHPSATAHVVLANFAAATIDQDSNGAKVAAVSGYLGPQILDTVRQGVNDRLNVLRLTNTRERSTLPSGVYGAVRYATGDRDAGPGVVAFDYDLLSYAVGYDAVVNDRFVVGGQITYTTAEAELAGDRGETEADAYGFAAYLGYRAGGIWADLSGAGSWENYDLERNTTFAQRSLATADPGGNSFYAALDVGANVVASDTLAAGPFAGVRYVDADVDGYTEAGAAMFNLAVAEQNDSGVIGSIGVQAAGKFEAGGASVFPHIRVAYENEVDEFDHRVATTSSVGQVRTAVGGTGNKDWILLGAGLNVQTGSSLSLSLDYEGTLDRSDGKDHSVVGRLIYAF
ncbi:MAG: autotransporter domain-containing protein [Rhodospirillaceae bacterium]|nr:autotransporter domain-containing protein [Rhodospirillaceae bacterium]